MRVAVVCGSVAPVPPIRPVGPALVIYYTSEHLNLPELRVFANWEPALDSISYDRRKYNAIKPYYSVVMLVQLFRKLPYYRVYKPLFSRMFQPHNPEFVKYAMTVPWEVRKFRPDIIVSHVNYSLVYWLRRVCPRAILLYYHHGSNMHLRLNEQQWRSFEKTVDGIIAVSQATFEGLQQKYGPINVPHWVIHNGVDIDIFHPLPETVRLDTRRKFSVADDEFVFLYIGRIVRSKGLDVLFDAFFSLIGKYPQARLLIVGSSKIEHSPEVEFENTLRQRAEGLNGKVQFIGAVPNSQIPQILSAADVVVLPSLADEGIPLSILEALACGKPVIATNKGGIQEVLKHEQTGLIINAEQIGIRLPAAMERMLQDSTLRQCCSHQAVEFIQNHCTYAHVARRLETILYQVWENRNAPTL